MIVGVSASDVFLEGMAADERSRGSIRGIGALDLNTQHCGETQRKIHERDRLRIQWEQKNSGHRNNRNT